MDFNKNYYDILSVKPDSDDKTIKKAYYKLSFKYHPDQNKDVDPLLFSSITEAYNILCSDDREEYDMKSKFGNNYNEYFEFFKIDIDFNYEKEKNNLDNFKRYEIDDIYISVDDTFDGNLEYERCVKCKTCDGTGKDLSSKIVIKDNNGKVIRIFDADDGCDFCEGSGKNYMGDNCTFCSGVGKIGMTNCKTCNGEKRILGKQKISNIKLTGDITKLELMGNCSKNSPGKVGNLFIKTN